jgi:hypothetical protein
MDKIELVIQNRGKRNIWWNTSEEKVVGKYGKLFHLENIEKLTKEEFKSFLLYKNNLHWEGIHRQGNIVTSDMKSLKAFLKYVLDESKPIEERLNTDFVEKGGYWVKGIGRAVITPILLVVYPEKYGVWNSKSEEGLEKLKLYPKFNRRDKFGDRYRKVNDALYDLSEKYSISLWQLDGVLGDLAGASPFESRKSSDEEEIEEDLKEHGIEDASVFGMEKHLEDFLVTNWDKTIFGKKYSLIYDKEGKDLLSQQYATDVGYIDILAESKDKKEYLVIELKKGRSSDSVFGQARRYIGWVKKHMAKGRTVKGIIVILDADDNLRYSLIGEKDISLYTYKVDFNLNKEKSVSLD